jgi:pantoate--beta-alanine ligase
MSKNPSRSTSKRPRLIRTLPALKRARGQWRAQHHSVALVPTMGALHAGHLALVRLAQSRAERVIVSIFVNPTQFAPSEDLGTYPRTFAADIAALAALGADMVWVPAAQTMYPPGFATEIVPAGAARAGLEDAFRPHFFTGVATVVTKLFTQCEPDIAVFGEKDYQQLKIVTRLARDLDLKIRIVAGKTVREADGLALSSRNLYLSPAERAAAPTLYRVLKECAAALAIGEPLGAVLERGRRAIAAAGFVLDYLEARDAETLAPARSAKKGPLRLLVAARIGGTRLIDNVAV